MRLNALVTSRVYTFIRFRDVKRRIKLVYKDRKWLCGAKEGTNRWGKGLFKSGAAVLESNPLRVAIASFQQVKPYLL